MRQVVALAPALALLWLGGGCESESSSGAAERPVCEDPALAFLDEGRQIFRYDTFGSERFFGDTLGLHLAVAGEANGGVGAGVSPATALGSA